jgi:FMN-dependent NADH-azoreductase
MPMYNWSMPSVFKAFIDSITRTGLTYLAFTHYFHAPTSIRSGCRQADACRAR